MYICRASKSSAKFKVIPKWNEYVKEHHDIARDAFHWWTFNNRPRYRPIYHSMRTSKAQFKYALRYAKNTEETARADSLANNFFDKNIDDFWSSVRVYPEQYYFIKLH